jgi:hypothetical protein
MSQPGRHVASPSTAMSGVGQDYFGAAPQAGAFTEQDDLEGAASTSLTTMPRGAVPINPQSPGDIIIPVEIGGIGLGRVRGEAARNVTRTEGQRKEVVPVELPS